LIVAQHSVAGSQPLHTALDVY